MPLMPVAQILNPAVAMVQLYDNIAAGAIASWDVQNISQAYNHLKLVFSIRESGAAGSDVATARFNNDSGANYDYETLNVSNTGGVSQSESLAQTSGRIAPCPGSTAVANLFAASEAMIPNYAQTVAEKAAFSFGFQKIGTTGASNNVLLNAYGMGWRSTAAINRITILPASGNFITGSRFSIYGIL